MIRTLVIFLLLAVLPFPSYATVKYDLDAYNIASWVDHGEKGISIRLTEAAKLGFLDLTRKNLNKKIELYVGALLVSSPIVRAPLTSGSMLLFVDNKLHEKVVQLLPQEKKDTGEIFLARNQQEIDSLIKNFLLSQGNTDPAFEETATSQGDALSDLNGDGKPEIVLVWTTLGKTYWKNTLTVFTAFGNGYIPISSVPLGGEARLSSVKDGIILVDQMIADEDDPVCCPSIKKQGKYKYQWAESLISELE